MSGLEINFDGLVGPTHNYAGLSQGNVASLKHANLKSCPKKAALQGLDKMSALHNLGFVQGLLPPQERPHIPTLKKLGFEGSDSTIVSLAAKRAPELLAACTSGSSMWTANAATVSPSPDTLKKKTHLSPANLVNKFHRSIEHPCTERILKAIFSNQNFFSVHNALPSNDSFGDEGAANHTRFCQKYDQPGVEFFVYGKSAIHSQSPVPKNFPARQTLEASQAIARRHQLNPKQTVFAQQNPEVIDQGVFHNDVIAVGNQNVHFFHEKAFLNSQQTISDLQHAAHSLGFDIHNIVVPNSSVSVQDAVESYLFNSQLLSQGNSMALVVPEECEKNKNVWSYLEQLKETDPFIKDIKVFDVKQSMQNGGGPACLRLRVALNKEEYSALAGNVIIDNALIEVLKKWVEKHYRETLSPEDLADPNLLIESRTALDELTQILQLGSIYDFQL